MRRLLSFAFAAGVAATLTWVVPPAGTTTPAEAGTPLQLTLPQPTGPDQIGTVSLHLVQNGRPDPWVPGRARELMVSLWYPARHADRWPTAPYMAPGAWASLERNMDIPVGSVVVPQTAGHEGAPVDRARGGLPVVLYSPPSSGDRDWNTALVENLASRGYLVVAIDHTYSDDEVEFPDGRVAQRVLPLHPTPQQYTSEIPERDRDTRFVLDELTALDRGRNPDAEHRTLPRGLVGALDLNRVGMFGHSLGGATTAATMLDDPRFEAGIDMDGTLWGPVASTGLTRPFLLLSNQTHDRGDDPSWATFWNASTGWKRDFLLSGSLHLSYDDIEVLLPELAPVLGIEPAQVAGSIGTIDPARAITVETAYVDAFFHQHLRGCDGHLLDGPSPLFPEMQFRP